MLRNRTRVFVVVNVSVGVILGVDFLTQNAIDVLFSEHCCIGKAV